MLEYITNFFTRLLAYSGDLTEGPFWCKFYLFAECARAYETWKQCEWIMWTLTCKHKIWGKKLVIFEALFKSLPCFQCSWNSQSIFIDDWSRDFPIYKKNLSSDFLENAKFVGVDQITRKNCNKSSWMQVNKILLTRDPPEQFPSVFVRSFQRNQTTMGWSRVSKAYRFL